ncbi:MAG TPA: tRNA 2-thiouridine(34) synthase MnmA [Alphaproteobacteria bacterium]|nr:tRNA 2-thiouridine(34) synthase MnmA [Alphaproteobacteria bacterium]
MTAPVNSLGLAKSPADTRVVVAMSGGVDSSVVAALLAEQGYDVVGVTLQLYDHGKAVGRPGSCCAGADIYDARRVADSLGIPHYVLDYEARFRQAVVDDFADTYLEGRTPIPCVRCNQKIKFRDLLDTARDLGADALATGHYARQVMGPSGPELHRARDASRDQSYFLFATTREQLSFLRFPLGAMEKSQVRREAARLSLPVAEKPDSQDICFVPDGDYARVVEKLRPGACVPGDIVHVDGRVLGSHGGVIHFTVGQRRGLKLGGESEPLYVVRIEPETARVVVGPRAALSGTRVLVSELNWLAVGGESEGVPVSVKLRSTQPPAGATLVRRAGTTAEAVLHEPQEAIAPGQACVFYDGDRVLGGGIIMRHSVRAAA